MRGQEIDKRGRVTLELCISGREPNVAIDVICRSKNGLLDT
jgi:hypothetical protein